MKEKCASFLKCHHLPLNIIKFRNVTCFNCYFLHLPKNNALNKIYKYQKRKIDNAKRFMTICNIFENILKKNIFTKPKIQITIRFRNVFLLFLQLAEWEEPLHCMYMCSSDINHIDTFN